MLVTNLELAKEYTKIILEINQSINEMASLHNSLLQTFFEENSPVTINTNGYECIISFLNFPIWYSNEDERPFDENKNEYMPLKEWLIFEIGRITALISDFNYLLMKDKI